MKIELGVSIIALLIAGCSSSGGQTNADAQMQDGVEDVQSQETRMDSTGEISVVDPVAQGKTALGNLAFKQAQEFFNTALNANPDDRQAKFGLVLADIQKWAGLTNAALSSYAPTSDLFGEKQSALTSEGQDLSAMLMTYFTDFRKNQTTDIGLLKACLQDPNFRFSIDHYPIYMEGRTRIDLGGTFDNADLLWLMSMEYGLRAIMDFLLANNWGQDGVRFFNILQKGLGFTKFGSSFAVMMQQEPGFLARPKDNADFQSFLDDLNSWADYGLKAADAIKAKARPDDAIFVLLPADKDKTLVEIRGRYAGDDGALKFLLTGPDYGLIDSYNKVQTAVAGNALLPLKQGFGVPLVVALDVVRQVVPLTGIISLFDLPDQYKSIIDVIQSKPADGTGFSDILFNSLPLFLFNLDAVALDLKAAKDTGFALRDLFAAMPDNAAILPYEGEYMEYDCPRIAVGDRAFVFDQNLKIVVWDLTATGPVSVTADVYAGANKIDTETFTLPPITEIPGLFSGKLKTRLSTSPGVGNSILEGDEKEDTVKVTYGASSTPVTVSITNGTPDSYAGTVDACQVKAASALDHFDTDFYRQIVKTGLPYKAGKVSDTAYRLWPGAAKKVIYVNTKVLKIDKKDEFVPADSYLFDVLAKNLL